MNIYKYRNLFVVIILCLFLVVTLTSCSFGKRFGISKSSSNSVSKNSIGMRFDVFKDDMTKDIELNDIEDKITFYYSGLELKEGSFVIQLFENQELLSEKKISSVDSSNGSFTFNEFSKESEYKIKIFAEDALSGNIKITW